MGKDISIWGSEMNMKLRHIFMINLLVPIPIGISCVFVPDWDNQILWDRPWWWKNIGHAPGWRIHPGLYIPHGVRQQEWINKKETGHCLGVIDPGYCWFCGISGNSAFWRSEFSWLAPQCSHLKLTCPGLCVFLFHKTWKVLTQLIVIHFFNRRISIRCYYSGLELKCNIGSVSWRNAPGGEVFLWSWVRCGLPPNIQQVTGRADDGGFITEFIK